MSQTQHCTCPNCKHLMPMNGCHNCQHYHAHYIKERDGRFSELYAGHCTTPRIKQRSASNMACAHWVERDTHRD